MDAGQDSKAEIASGRFGMSQQLEITEVDHDGTCRLVMRGELDVASAHSVGDRLHTLLADHRRIIIDLSELSFIDSTGLGVLVRATEAADQNGVMLTIAALSETVMRVVELTGLAERLHLTTVEDQNP